MENRTYEGLLCLHSWGEADDILFLSSLDDPMVEELEWMHNKIATVRYWITDKEATKEEVQKSFIAETMGGVVDAYLCPRYSEITGYLWTDEDLNVGGHDLLARLKSNVGKWLILEIEEGAKPESVQENR